MKSNPCCTMQLHKTSVKPKLYKNENHKDKDVLGTFQSWFPLLTAYAGAVNKFAIKFIINYK